MQVRILNHDAYGEGDGLYDYKSMFPVGSVHFVYEFFPDTGEVDLGNEDGGITFAPSEYIVVEEEFITQ